MTDFERMLVDELRELRREQHELRESIADLREAVARLESESTERVHHTRRPRSLAHSGGLTISGAAIGSAVLWIIQHLAAK